MVFVWQAHGGWAALFSQVWRLAASDANWPTSSSAINTQEHIHTSRKSTSNLTATRETPPTSISSHPWHGDIQTHFRNSVKDTKFKHTYMGLSWQQQHSDSRLYACIFTLHMCSFVTVKAPPTSSVRVILDEWSQSTNMRWDHNILHVKTSHKASPRANPKHSAKARATKPLIQRPINLPSQLTTLRWSTPASTAEKLRGSRFWRRVTFAPWGWWRWWWWALTSHSSWFLTQTARRLWRPRWWWAFPWRSWARWPWLTAA